MDLLQLEHLLAVAEERSFTRAAERVFRTQPAVSQSIKKLEDAVGLPLFARDTPELALTEAGRMMVEYARRMLQLRDDTVRKMDELRSMSSGSLSIAAHESAALYLMPGPLREYLSLFPRIKVRIERSRLEDIPRLVMDRDVDIGFVKDGSLFHELRSVVVYSDEMILIASPRHPFAGRKSVRVPDLGREPFVVHHLCSSTERLILRLFEAHATQCNIVAELWSFENVKHFVQQDVGMAIVPRVTVMQDLQAGTLVEIPVEGLDVPRRTLMVFRDQGFLSTCGRQFVDIVQQFNWDLWLPRWKDRPETRAETRRRAMRVMTPRDKSVVAETA